MLHLIFYKFSKQPIIEDIIENSFTNILNLKNGIDGWSKEVDKNVPTY